MEVRRERLAVEWVDGSRRDTVAAGPMAGRDRKRLAWPQPSNSASPCMIQPQGCPLLPITITLPASFHICPCRPPWPQLAWPCPVTHFSCSLHTDALPCCCYYCYCWCYCFYYCCYCCCWCATSVYSIQLLCSPVFSPLSNNNCYITAVLAKVMDLWNSSILCCYALKHRRNWHIHLFMSNVQCI